MTSPNLGDGSLDDFADAANAIGLAAMQAMQAEDHIQAQIAAVAGPLGGIVEFITDGLGSIIADIQAYVTTGDTANLTAAAEFVQSKITGLLGDVLRLLDALWEAMSGEYEGDDAVLQGIQTLFAPLRKLIELITGAVHGLAAAPAAVVSWLSNLQNYMQGNVIGSDPAGFFTGLGNVAQSLMDALFGGYTGTVSSGATVSDLSSTMSSVDSRITALEGGGTRYYLTSSTTLDLSGKSMVRALLWGSSQTPVTGTGRWGDAAGVDGGYLCYEISASLFDDYGVDMSAVEVVVGTAGAASKIGKTGTWIAQTVPGRARIGTAQGLIEAEGPGSGGAGGRGMFGDGSDQNPTAGDAGAATTMAAAGSGGAGNSGGNGGDGGNGAVADVDIPGPKTGGSGGGGGGGGGRVLVVAFAGGSGGHGGFPGGGPGGGGGPGNYLVYASRGTPGSRANGVAVLEVY